MRLPMMRRLALGIVAAAAIVAPGSAGASTVFTLTGHGWGHGIGMSQYGALGYAEHGWGYRQMMDHYFTGTHVAPLRHSATERVLLSSGANGDFGASSRLAPRAAGRAYAIATRSSGGDFDAYADTRSQVYGPIEHEASASNAAVAGTVHQVVWYRGTVATTFFSSSSGGRTSSEQAAWDTTSGEPY